MNMEYTRRQILDHARYERDKEKRRQKQRDYYAMNTQKCRDAVHRCIERHKMEYFSDDTQ